MLRTTIRYLIPAVLVALAGCERQELPGVAGQEADGEKVVASFSFGIDGYGMPDTKSLATDITDNEVDRIDVYSYDVAGELIEHKVLGGDGNLLNLGNLTFCDYAPDDEKRNYLFIANLDADSAEYIGILKGAEVCQYPKGFIPWSAGNCRPNRPLMAATAFVRFSSYSAQAVNISLMRYMCKFEIGTVTAELWGTQDQFRNIYLSHIVLSNSWDLVRICQRDPRYFAGTPEDIFGSKGWTSAKPFGGVDNSNLYLKPNLFMGQDDWSTYNLTYAVMDGTYNQGCYGGLGLLNQEYAYLYNNNYLQPKGSINLSAPECLKTVSQQSWDNNAYLPAVAGKLCGEYDGSLGPLEVNKVFYTLPTFFTVTSADIAYDPSTGQDRAHKLVLAVKINGRKYYYPIRLAYLQPNMLYRIRNITLKGEPSEYANVWKQGGVVSRSAERPGIAGQAGNDGGQWKVVGNVAEIENLVLYGEEAVMEEEDYEK